MDGVVHIRRFVSQYERTNGDKAICKKSTIGHHVDKLVKVENENENGGNETGYDTGKKRRLKFGYDIGELTKEKTIVGHSVDDTWHRKHGSVKRRGK